MVKERKIWVVNSAGHDFTPALKYTTLPKDKAFIFLTQGSENIFQADRVKSELRQKLLDFKESDILLICGSNVLNIQVVLIVLEKFRNVDVLLYDGRTKEYTIRQFRFEGEEVKDNGFRN